VEEREPNWVVLFSRSAGVARVENADGDATVGGELLLELKVRTLLIVNCLPEDIVYVGIAEREGILRIGGDVMFTLGMIPRRSAVCKYVNNLACVIDIKYRYIIYRLSLELETGLY
jgi:hypothetical protein